MAQTNSKGETMHSRLKTSDLIPRLLCVVIAVIIWLYVMSNESPDYERTFSGVTVSIENAALLTSESELSVISGYGERADITVTGKKSDLISYSLEDIVPSVDVGGITTPGGKPTMSVMCFGFDTFADASYACWDIHTRWAEKMDRRFGGAPNIRDFIVVPEGVFKSDEEIWEAMTETIIEAGYEGRAGFQMDVATDTYHNKEDGKYYGLFNNQPKTKDQLYEFYLHIIKEFPFVILEDPFNEDDYDTTAALTKDSGIQIVGDDLFTTNIRRVAYGVTKGAANTILLKVNQIGTISEALEMIQYAYKFGYAVMPSDSRGEGESIADYAVGINAGSVRECGIGPRANRFMEIEAELGKTAKFLGARGLKGFKNQQRADALERKE